MHEKCAFEFRELPCGRPEFRNFIELMCDVSEWDHAEDESAVIEDTKLILAIDNFLM